MQQTNSRPSYCTGTYDIEKCKECTYADFCDADVSETEIDIQNFLESECDKLKRYDGDGVEKRRIRQRRYNEKKRAENPQCFRDASKRYYYSHREQVLARIADYHQNHKEERCRKRRERYRKQKLEREAG